MRRMPSLARPFPLALAALSLILVTGLGPHQATLSHAAAALTATPAAVTPVPTGAATLDTSSLLPDETDLLSTLPALSGNVPMSALPPITGSVAGLEGQIINLIGRVQGSSLSSSARDTLLGQLQDLNLALAPALDQQDQIDTLRG